MALTLDVLVLFWVIPIFKIIEKTEKITFEFFKGILEREQSFTTFPGNNYPRIILFSAHIPYAKKITN